MKSLHRLKLSDIKDITRRRTYYIDKYIARHFSPTVCTNNHERAGNDVINILTSEDMENTPLESRMFYWKIHHSASGVFSSKTRWFGKQTNIQLDYLNRIVILSRSESNTYFHCKIRS